MIYRYHISFKQHFMLLIQPILLYVIIVGMVYYWYHKFNFIPLVITLSSVFLLDTLPALILHIQYLIKNYKAIVLLNTTDRTFSYRSFKQKEKVSNFSDIKLLEYYVSYARKMGIYSFARYRYYKIILSNDEEIVITCLMINDIENTLEVLLQIKAEKEPRVLCFIK
jgi:hypothetical protein